MKAMEYEYLIRRAYQCGRDYSIGADADIYRKYDRNFTYLEKVKRSIIEGKPEPLTRSLDDLEYDYRVAAISVNKYIGNAIRKVLKDHAFELTDQQKETLQNCIPNHDEYDKTKTEGYMNQADKIMFDIGLFPR